MKPTRLSQHPGARLHWHAARIRAQQLSAPKRKPVAAVGDHLANAASQSSDDCCRLCGHFLCSCAPQPTKALDTPPTPAPSDPWAPGKRVRCVNDDPMPSGELSRVTRGRVYEILKHDGYALCLRGAGDKEVWLRRIRFEPIPDAPPSKTPEQREAWVPPGWSVNHEFTRGNLTLWEHASGVTAWVVADLDPSAFDDGNFSWCTTPGQSLREGGAPTLAQACCAALGIEIDRCEDECLYVPFLNGNCCAPGIFVTAEDAARAALEAHAKASGR